MLSLLFNNPIVFVAWLAAILVGLTVHEFSHAFSANMLGDDTAERQGRVTLNPLAHIDILGLIMLILVGFGWGKPVPVNPYNLRHGKAGRIIVATAGILSNLIFAIIFGFVLKFMVLYGALAPDNVLGSFLVFLVYINVMLMVFNLLPIPPLDGSKVLMDLLPSPRYDRVKIFLMTKGPLLLLFLVIFDNFLPFSIFGTLFNLAMRMITALVM